MSIFGLKGRSLTESFNNTGEPLQTRQRAPDSKTLDRGIKKANDLLEQLASHLGEEIDKAAKAGATAYHYDATILASAKSINYLQDGSSDYDKPKAVDRYNAFSALPLNVSAEKSELEKSFGFVKLHEACKAADKAVEINRDGVTIHFNKPYSAGQMYSKSAPQSTAVAKPHKPS